MKFYLARHGETDLNIEERFQGISDFPLNARGAAQAVRLEHSLPDDIEQVVSSPQRRAYQTAETVSRVRGLPHATMVQFRERDFGQWEGLTHAQARAAYPALWARGGAFQWHEAPPGAEATHEVVARVEEGLRLLVDAHAGRSVLLVAHGFVVRSLRYLLEGVAQADFFVAPRIGNGEFLVFPEVRPAAARRPPR